MTEKEATTKPIRLRGHAVERMAVRGGTIAECTCGTTLTPKGTRQTGRSVDLGIFTGAPEQIRANIRMAHETHKQEVLDRG